MNYTHRVIPRLFLLLWLFTASTVMAESMAGNNAPRFELADQYGEIHKLEDFSGKWLVLYFYPRDDTPGCTTEACNFRDNIFAFRAIGAEVIGISVDDTESHKEFSEKYKLPFKILSDTGGEVTRAYGALKDMKIVKYAKRQSFLIDPDGVIVKHYEKVDPDTHTQQVLTDLKTLMAPGTPEAE